jgi:hypothetical protein
MKKTFTLLVAIAASVFAFSQNMVLNGDMESWDNATTPTSWELYDNVSQNSTYVHGGTYSAGQMSDESSQKLRQDIDGIVGGTQYTISFYFLDNTLDAKTRIWSYWMEDGTYLDDNEEELRPGEYSTENPDWQHYTVTLTAPVNANQFRFDVRTYKQDGATGGYIYFDDFSITAETTTYPEPSNYPTNVMASANGLTIDLTWDESVGTQLPNGYIIYGKMSEFPPTTVPVDGVPVENDLDWSDGNVAVNVGYGSGGYSFGSLSPSQMYTFSVYPFTNSGSNIDYKTDGTAPSAGATTANISQVVYEPFDSDLGVFSGYNVTGPQEWEWADYGDPPGCAKGNGYSGGAVENEDWLISSKLEVAGYIELTLGFQHARNYASNDGLEVAVSTDYTGSGDPTAANWDYITDMFTFPQSGSWDFIDAGVADISNYISASTYIAFVYNSTDSDASTWEIDNVEVLGILGTSVEENAKVDFKVYPNPAHDHINIHSKDIISVNLYSISGQLILSKEIEAESDKISITEIPAGIYFLEAISASGKSFTEKLSVK